MLGAQVTRLQSVSLLCAITVRAGDRTETIEADVLAMSGGWNPDVGLTRHHGARPVG